MPKGKRTESTKLITTGRACDCYPMLLKDQIYRFVLSKVAQVETYAGRLSSQLNRLVPLKKIITPLSLIFFSTLSVSLFPLPPAQAMETIIPVIYLNEEQKGEYFVKMTEDHDFLIKAEDLKAIGLLDPKGKSQDVEGISYLSLKSLAKVTFFFDEKKLALKIQASPEQLARTVLDFSNKRQKAIYYSKENSVFYNYGLTLNAGKGFKYESFSTTGQLGIRVGNFLLLSDSIVSTTGSETKFNRLMSSITYDRRDRMDAFVFGDFYTTSGNLGSCQVLGGLSYSKNYSADPNVIKRPVQGYQGFVTLPSEVSVYLNGVRIKSEKVPAGGFDLKNILAYGGRQDMEIVIKDAFGREQHIANPFYVSDTLLSKGFHDYSYNIGFQRNNIGASEDQYGDPAFLGFHRYGLTNNLTVGLRGEAAGGLYNMGPNFSYGTNFGVFDLALAGSRDKGDKSGWAGSVNYTFQGKRFNTRLGFSNYAEDYATISTSENTGLSLSGKTKYEAYAGVGFGTKNFGSVGLNYSKAVKYDTGERQIAGILYSKGIGRNFSLSLSLTHTNENGPDTNTKEIDFFVSLTYYPWKETIMTNTGMTGDQFRGNIQVQKNAPIGEGYGYRAALDVSEEQDKLVTRFRPYFQYKGPFGIYSTDITTSFGGTNNYQSYQFNASGAIVYVGNSFGFSRPVDDSFAIVKVGKVPGVRVFHNNQLIGRTDRSGTAVLPTFHSYDENQIRINDKDIPLEYALKKVSRIVSPPLRSGTLIKFEAKKVQAFTGMLTIEKDGQRLPVEFQLINLKKNEKIISFQTGRGGEFFIEDAEAGTFQGSFKYGEKKVTFTLTIPKSNETIIDGGEIHVQIQP